MLFRSRLPPGAIIVIVKEEEMQGALRLVPKGMVISAEEYQALPDKIALLEARLKPDKPGPPGSCHLSGRVEGNVVREILA